MEVNFPRSDGCGGEIFQSWSGGKCSEVMGWRGDLPKSWSGGKCSVVTFIITDSMQIDFEVIRCPVNQELSVIN